MDLHRVSLSVPTCGSGLVEITDRVAAEVVRSGLREGLVSIFCRHTSCSLVIMENADPSARRDLQRWLERLVPAQDPDFTHTAEGLDDMPSHIKMALTRTSETVPLVGGRLMLGSWQGVFLWEHRCAPHNREVVVTVLAS